MAITIKQQSFIFYYYSLGILFIFLEHLHTYIPALIVKAILIPSLILFYHSHIKGNYNLLHRLVMIGLGFSWIGDISLQLANGQPEIMLSANNMFILGLAAFLVTQVFYIAAFSLPRGKHKVLTSRSYQTILVMAYGFVLIWYLYHSLGDMKIPVILYAAIILLMLLSALNRYGKVNGVSYMLVVIGALFFVISDSMIAINRFHMKFDFAKTLIMVTYITAQYLIVMGCIRQDSLIVKNSNNAV
jgi:uncharacterized membrane protein YhhN